MPISDTQARPEDQLTDLMNRYEQPLSGYLLLLLGDRDVVRDCAQDTFLRAYEHLRSGKNVNAQWLYKVARNRAIDHLRHRQREQSEPEALEAMITEELGEPDRIVAVRLALQKLPSADREVLYLFTVDKFDTRQIAAMLGIRPGAARVRLYRARERFRSVYSPPRGAQ
ncbi:MAG TPA: sigma-70 family RNA polymerase sigma factor [Chloroflexota bacterium]